MMIDEINSDSFGWAEYVVTNVSDSIDQCSMIPPLVPTKRLPSSI